MLIFTCPKCGKHELEEVGSAEEVNSTIDSISEDGVEYAGVSITGDYFTFRYQCSSCGYILTAEENDDDLVAGQDMIDNEDDLIEWLEDHS